MKELAETLSRGKIIEMEGILSTQEPSLSSQEQKTDLALAKIFSWN